MYSIYEKILSKVQLPSFYSVKQISFNDEINNLEKSIISEMDTIKDLPHLFNGKTIAIAVGSRGIDKISEVTKIVINYLKQFAKEIYVVPAMGSHGGADATNQTKILELLGITEKSIGVPIRSSMETIVLTTTEDNIPIHMDKNACLADFTIPINKIAPHSGFHGDYESGLIKMCVVGLGKQQGADWCHEQGMENMSTNLKKIGSKLLPISNIPFCIGLIENSKNKTCWVGVVTKEEIIDKEPKLLEKSKSFRLKIPFTNIDLLIVDFFGKNIAGSGMDGNVINRYATQVYQTNESAKRIVVLNLTKESDGNFSGFGLADISTRRVFNSVSMEATYPNYLTSRCIAGGRIPLIMENDFDAIRAGLKTASNIDMNNPRIVHIKSTKDLEIMEISEALKSEIEQNPNIIEISDKCAPLVFDTKGALISNL
jgi:hypothetical protein